MMSELHADRLFLAVDVSICRPVPRLRCSRSATEQHDDALGARVTVVADFSKLGRRAISKIGPFDRIHRLITDKQAPAEFTEALRQKGIEVIEV